MARIIIDQHFKTSRVTRADGAKLRSLIEERWSDSEPLILDFSGLRIASASFFDESVGALAETYPLELLTQRLRMENMDPADRKLLNQIVLSRASSRRSKDDPEKGASV
jgi:hypothetical protein